MDNYIETNNINKKDPWSYLYRDPSLRPYKGLVYYQIGFASQIIKLQKYLNDKA